MEKIRLYEVCQSPTKIIVQSHVHTKLHTSYVICDSHELQLCGHGDYYFHEALAANYQPLLREKQFNLEPLSSCLIYPPRQVQQFEKSCKKAPLQTNQNHQGPQAQFCAKQLREQEHQSM